MIMNEKLIEKKFREVYPDERFQMKSSFILYDMYNDRNADTIVVEFIDTKVKRAKTMEVSFKRYELKE